LTQTSKRDRDIGLRLLSKIEQLCVSGGLGQALDLDVTGVLALASSLLVGLVLDEDRLAGVVEARELLSEALLECTLLFGLLERRRLDEDGAEEVVLQQVGVVAIKRHLHAHDVLGRLEHRLGLAPVPRRGPPSVEDLIGAEADALAAADDV